MMKQASVSALLLPELTVEKRDMQRRENEQEYEQKKGEEEERRGEGGEGGREGGSRPAAAWCGAQLR